MPKKKTADKKLILIILVLFLAFLIIQFYPSVSPTGKATQTTDFPNSQEGTFSGWTQETYYQESLDETIVFFASATIPNLAIIYYPQEKKLTAGLPQMTAENLVFFDGQQHHLVYTFKQNGQQTLFYDGQEVASSAFQSSAQITGLVTGTLEPKVSEALINVEIS